jgi:Leucine-rich repeat (LRR) protein
MTTTSIDIKDAQSLETAINVSAQNGIGLDNEVTSTILRFQEQGLLTTSNFPSVGRALIHAADTLTNADQPSLAASYSLALEIACRQLGINSTNFEGQKSVSETLPRSSTMLPDGRPIDATDYLTLCRLAADNKIEPNEVLERIELDSAGRVTEISLSNLKIFDISQLGDLTALTRLNLSYNQITDISPMQNLTALTHLYLNDNNIVDISPVQNLTALTHLDLSSNQIADIRPMQNLTALTYLGLDNNNIVDISPVQNLMALTFLGLHNNPL